VVINIKEIALLILTVSLSINALGIFLIGWRVGVKKGYLYKEDGFNKVLKAVEPLLWPLALLVILTGYVYGME
jgi:hypothetical protein